MNEDHYTELESDLKRLRPAQPPADLMVRMAAARPTVVAPRPSETAARRRPRSPWWMNWKLWVPATALVVAALVLWRLQPAPPAAPASPEMAAATPLKADSVQIDRQLVASFDAVARLPGGEPIRFRCREWVDEVVLQDKARGLVVEQRAPRLEVIPVRFETY